MSKSFSNKQSYYAYGKLLLSGEYLVIYGAKALAIPLRRGQSMEVMETNSNILDWQARSLHKDWFSAQIQPDELRIIKTSDEEKAKVLRRLLKTVKKLDPVFFKGKAFKVQTNLDFKPEWGLGSSSTLVSNLAEWAGVDAFHLNAEVFRGSGYDIACAHAEGPLVYQLIGGKPKVQMVDFQPPFADRLWLVWLNRKQNSRQGISAIARADVTLAAINEMNTITEQMVSCASLDRFFELLNESENLLANILKTEKVGTKLFPDFKGVVKSLGAWGGDFVLAASNEAPVEVVDYFKKKGFKQVFNYRELVK